MGAPRFFSQTPLAAVNAGTVLELDQSAAHHATRVLRLVAGDELTLFDGTGGEYDARLERVDRRDARVRVLRFVPEERESPLALTLVQGVAANDAMDSVIRRATELGVTSILPLLTARSAPLPAGERAEKRHAHWQQVAIAACEQCGRNRIPDIGLPQSFSDWLREWAGSSILFIPDASQSLAAVAHHVAPLALLVGPEGGFDPREVGAAKAKGFAAVTLGPRVLRTETAVAAAIALAQARWGDLR